MSFNKVFSKERKVFISDDAEDNTSVCWNVSGEVSNSGEEDPYSFLDATFNISSGSESVVFYIFRSHRHDKNYVEKEMNQIDRLITELENYRAAVKMASETLEKQKED